MRKAAASVATTRLSCRAQSAHTGKRAADDAEDLDRKRTRLEQPSSLVRKLRDSLSAVGNPADAVAMRKYLRDQFPFLGVKTPTRRAILKQLTVDDELVVPLALQLITEPERELNACGVDLATMTHTRVFVALDASTAFGYAETLLTTKSWWDTVDILSSRLVGSLVRAHPEIGSDRMEQWISHDNMWLRRSAILHQLNYGVALDAPKLFRFCLARAHETEFFIQKAIGWALRDFARKDPRMVRDFVVQHRNTLSKLSVREATKHIGLSEE